MSNRPKGGKNCGMSKDKNILAIKSPKKMVSGPYTVVQKDTVNRWAIVTMCWEGDPRLGIRWFWKKLGNPQSSGYATWMVIPGNLCLALLPALLLDKKTAHDIKQFLIGKLPGEKLQ